MAHAIYKDRIRETTRTQGTGTYALAGAQNGFQGFSAIGVGNACYYCCEDGTSWEVGSGHYTASALTRFPIATSNSNNLVSWGGGTRHIYAVLPASQIGAVDGSSALDDMSDVVAPSPSFRQRLSYNGSTWIPSGIFQGDLPSGLSVSLLTSGTVSNDEFGRLAGVTSAIQTQLAGKASTAHTHAVDDLSDAVVTSAAIRQRLAFDGTNWVNSGLFIPDLPSGISAEMISNGAVTNTEFGYLDGTTSAIQTQIDGKSSTAHTHTLDGLSDVVVTSATYRDRIAYNGSSWVNSGLFPADIPSGLLATSLGSGTASPSKALMGDMGWGLPTGPLLTVPDGATITFNLSDSSLFNTTLGGNRTLAIQSGVLGQRFFTRLTQDSAGSRTVTWFNGANFPGGTAPTLTTTANKADWIGFVNISGTTYDGFTMGQNY